MKKTQEDLVLVTELNNLELKIEDKLEELASKIIFSKVEVTIFKRLWDYHFNCEGSLDLVKEIEIANKDYYTLLGIEYQSDNEGRRK